MIWVYSYHPAAVVTSASLILVELFPLFKITLQITDTQKIKQIKPKNVHFPTEFMKLKLIGHTPMQKHNLYFDERFSSWLFKQTTI